MKRYPYWSYLSITAMDAPIISIAWHLYFVQNSNNCSIIIEHCFILGISVWLAYMADRLFDIRLKKRTQLTSLRHKFCKENEIKLWIIWAAILIPTTIFSLITLNSDNIFVGLSLILFILLYNFLNQYFSRKRFPKEICVAVLFSYGTLYLVGNPIKINGFLQFTIICFLNCIILTHKEVRVDKLMCVNSWTHAFTHRSILIIIVSSYLYLIFSLENIYNPLCITCLISLLMHIFSNYIEEEAFRNILEFTYIIIPLSTLIV